MVTTDIHPVPLALTFVLKTTMTSMQTMIEITMDFESVCAKARTKAGATERAYIPYTLIEYGAIIDRATHADYLLVFATVSSEGVPPDAPDPFVENLTDSHDEHTNALDVYIESKNWNVVYRLHFVILSMQIP
jgi:hypothetical protein